MKSLKISFNYAAGHALLAAFPLKLSNLPVGFIQVSQPAVGVLHQKED